jgi:hypothetical protein
VCPLNAPPPAPEAVNRKKDGEVFAGKIEVSRYRVQSGNGMKQIPVPVPDPNPGRDGGNRKQIHRGVTNKTTLDTAKTACLLSFLFPQRPTSPNITHSHPPSSSSPIIAYFEVFQSTTHF